MRAAGQDDVGDLAQVGGNRRQAAELLGISRTLAYELVKRGLRIEKQKPLPVVYDDVNIDCAYRLDFVVNDEVVVEVKSVERLTHVHDAQLISYLKLSKKRVGLLINFNVKWLTDEGIRRRVNDPK